MGGIVVSASMPMRPGPDAQVCPGPAQVISATAPEKLRKASTVDTRMMRATRPPCAPKRSVSSETL